MLKYCWPLCSPTSYMGTMCGWSSFAAASASARNRCTSASVAKITGKDGTNGRDHWTSCWSALIAGAGIGGGVYGASDKIGAYVKDFPVRPQDLGATVYHALGVPLNSQTQVGGRAITTGEPILKLFG